MADLATPDYYALLGLQPTATVADIKRAYRAAAKRTHPDAGGSAEAMQHLNHAHRVLTDPSTRAEYDRLRAIQAQTHASDTPTEREHYERQEATIRAGLHHQLRLAQARANAWYILRSSAFLTVLLGIITSFFAAQTRAPSSRLVLAFIVFIPAYGIILGLIFLINPQIRLDLFDFIHQATHPHSPNPHLSRADKLTLLALGLAFIPLAIIWTLLFNSFIQW